MNRLSLSCLGSFQVVYNAASIDRFRSNRVQALLVYLAVEHAAHPGIRHTRDSLMTLLWPGMPDASARQNLRQTLYLLRQEFPSVAAVDGRDDVPLVESDRSTVQVHPNASIDLDVAAFLSQARGGRSDLERALTLYRGDFLADFYLPDSNPFEEWVEANREACRRRALDILGRLAERYLADADYEQAEALARRQLEMDELREGAHRQLMSVLARTGRRAEALAHFEETRLLLREELDIEPSSETHALAEDIRAGDVGRETAGKVGAPASSDVARAAEPAVVPSSLPLQTTPFIGRVRELESLDAFIADPHVRLVTVIGAGGMGKTRLALACAERQLGPGEDRTSCRFPDGVFFVSLAPFSQPADVLPAVAESINLFLEAGESSYPPRQQLLDHLRARHILLVLDNFEHLLEAAPLLTDILQHTLHVQLLVTSRERLHLQAEQLFPIDGLAFADWRTIEETTTAPAAQLFVQAAARAQPAYQLQSDADAVNLAQLCRLVDGMPLALELAAGWVELLSLEQIVDEIEKGLDLLETDLVDVPQRHRAMRCIFHNTWARLGENEEAILACFSVFRGGCTTVAVREVTGASLRALAHLTDKSLLRFDRRRRRYYMHELLRQYATERLSGDEGQRSAARRAHSHYYCQALGQWEKALNSVQQADALAAIEADYENIRVAWNWALQQLVIDDLAIAAGGLYEYFYASFRPFEAEELFGKAAETIVAAFGESPESVGAACLLASLRAKQYINADSILGDEDRRDMGKLLESLQLALRALQSQPLADENTATEEAFVRLQMARVLRWSDELRTEMRSHARESLRLYESLGDKVGAAEAMRLLGAAEDSRQAQKARYKESIELSRQVGALEQLGFAQRQLAMLVRSEGDFEEATALYEQTVDIGRENRFFKLAMFALRDSAYLGWFLGDFQRAEGHFRTMHEMALQAGREWLAAECLANIGMTGAYDGRFERAQTLLNQALDTGLRRTAPDALGFLSFTRLHLGHYASSVDMSTNVIKLVAVKLFTMEQYWSKRIISWAEIAMGEYASAADRLAQNLADQPNLGFITAEHRAWTQAALAIAQRHLGRSDEAWQTARQSLHTCLEIHAFLPLMHLMPILPVLLADAGRIERAVEIYALAETRPFVANSQLFKDIARSHVDEAAATLDPVVIHAAQARGRLLDWWQTAETLLAELPPA